MKVLIRGSRGRLCAIAVVLTVIVPKLASAAPVYSSSVRVVAANLEISNQADLVRGAYGNGALTTNSGSGSFSGKDGQGNSATMSFSASGQSQAGASGLKASSSATLENAFFNAGNAPYVIDKLGHTNRLGTPTSFWVESFAMMSDELTMVGGTGLSSIRANISIDGQTQSNSSSWVGGPDATVYQRGQLNGAVWNSGFPEDQDLTLYDVNLVTGSYAVTGNVTNFGLALVARNFFVVGTFIPNYDYLPTYSSSSDFFNTLTIDSFAGFDANGNAVDLVSVTGSDGYLYSTVRVNPSTVPEPGSLALLSLGLLGTALARRKRHTVLDSAAV